MNKGLWQMPRREALPCIRASVGECLHISDSEQTTPFLTATRHAKTCVRKPVEHLWGHSTQATQSCWSYDNLCQLIVWVDNLRTNLELENRNLLHHNSRPCIKKRVNLLLWSLRKTTKSMVMNCSKEQPAASWLNQSKWKLHYTLTFQGEASVKHHTLKRFLKQFVVLFHDFPQSETGFPRKKKWTRRKEPLAWGGGGLEKQLANCCLKSVNVHFYSKRKEQRTLNSSAGQCIRNLTGCTEKYQQEKKRPLSSYPKPLNLQCFTA